MNYLTLEKCLEYADLGWLDKHESADGKLVGFKYSRQTVYDGAWDEITLQCRGIVFDKSTGDIIAHPFNKFFNYEEIYDVTTDDGYMRLTKLGETLTKLGHEFEPRITKNFRAMDKLDGSLGILFYYEDKWIIKTGGSFNSDQAKWAQKWFDKNIAPDRLEHLNEGWDYCFEIISKDDPHVCHYDYEGLVLLGFFDENHVEGEMIDVVELAYKLGVRYSEASQFSSYEDMVKTARDLDVDHEGFVVTFESGFKVKVKGLEYLSKFHMISGITKKDIRLHFDIDKLHVDPEYKAAIPEELPQMQQYAELLDNECSAIKIEVQDVVFKIAGLTGRERYEKAIAEGGKFKGSLAVAITCGKSVNEKIFHHVVEKLKMYDPEEE
jgi:RNA ligase